MIAAGNFKPNLNRRPPRLTKLKCCQAEGRLNVTQSSKTPYVRDAHRLADVLAAIQAMGSYKFYKLTFDRWADRISGDVGKAAHWQRVFEEHPEFFRLDSERKRASLIWRRQHPKLFHVDQERKLSKDEFEQLEQAEKSRVSRIALGAGEIQALMQAAIDLHSRAIEHQRERRWWLPLIASAIGGLLGALVGVGFSS